MQHSSSSPAPIIIGDAVADDFGENRVLIPPVSGALERPPSDQIWTLDGASMGTTWQVRLIAPAGAAQESYRTAIHEELDRVIALFSPWVEHSEITRFNTAPKGDIALSPDFYDLLSASLDLSDAVNGAVDPTLGALVDLWGFGPTGPSPSNAPIPSDGDIALAQKISGRDKLSLNHDHRTAHQIGGLRLDFSGIAKGHAVDRVSDRLKAMGATSHLVEIGGELKGVGVKPDGQPWWVEIEAVEGTNVPRTVAALFDLAVATSGDWRKSFTHDGIHYSHTIDGFSGRPVSNGVAQVTVFDALAMRADTLATAFTVLGPDAGLDMASAMGVAAHFILRTESGLSERYSPAYAAMMEDEA